MGRSVRFSAFLVALVASVTACGGGTYKGLTKTEFLRQANASCAQVTKDGQDLRKQLPANPTTADVAKLDKDKELPLLDHELDKIAALKPPKADRDRVKKMIEDARSAAKTFAAKLDANPEKALAQGTNLFEKSNAAFKAYGLATCAS